MSESNFINIDKFHSWYNKKRPYDETAMFVSPEYASIILFQNEFVHEVNELVATLRLYHQADSQEIATDIKVIQPIELSGLSHEQQVKAVFNGLVELNEQLLQSLADNSVRSPSKHINRMFSPKPSNTNTVSFHLQTKFK